MPARGAPSAAEADVVVVGSGAAGLTCALAALDAGASVAVLEKAPVLGGTSALSGGMIWVPGNPAAVAAGVGGSTGEALTYMRAVTRGLADDSLLQAHLDRGPELLRFVDDRADLRFTLIGSFPDYHPELPGGAGGGRSVEPEPYDLNRLGELRPLLRDDPRPAFTQREYFEEWRTYRNFPWDELERRRDQGIGVRGRALVAPLVKAVADAGGSLAVDAGARRLLVDGAGRAVGVGTDAGAVRARRAVVLASGGFEWDDDLCRRFLSGPVQSRCSVPGNVGDGLRMAMAAGADLGNMGEAWWAIHAAVPGLQADGRELATIMTVERSLPGSIVVNRHGRRFANESQGYYTLGKVLATFDPLGYGYANLPAFLVADGRFLRTYGILGASDPEGVPPWLHRSATLAGLAAEIGVDADGLQATVERFNEHARRGADPDFHRGESRYDRYFGDPSAPHPNLGALAEPPFVAVGIECGAIGTKGGARTDADGRVLDPWGEPVGGLFAVGNVAAHPVAFGYLGAGTTLGPAMTMAMAAGRAAAGGC